MKRRKFLTNTLVASTAVQIGVTHATNLPKKGFKVASLTHRQKKSNHLWRCAC